MTLFIDSQTRYMTAMELPFPRTGEGIVHMESDTPGIIQEDHFGVIIVRLPEGSMISVGGYRQEEWLAPARTVELQPSSGCGYAGC